MKHSAHQKDDKLPPIAYTNRSGTPGSFLKRENLMSAKEAALYLFCKQNRIHNLVSLGKLEPTGRDGRRLLFSKADLDSYIQSNS